MYCQAHIPLDTVGNLEPFIEMSAEILTQALKEIINVDNHPILIHCDKVMFFFFPSVALLNWALFSTLQGQPPNWLSGGLPTQAAEFVIGLHF